MASWLDQARGALGTTLASAGTYFNLPELNLSERLGVTGKWGQIPTAHAAEKTPSGDRIYTYDPNKFLPYDPFKTTPITDKGSGGGGDRGGNPGETEQQRWDRQWREAGNTGQRPEGYHGPGGGGSSVDEFGSIIDRDYETAMGGLNYEEQNLRGSAEAATQTAVAGYAPAKTAIANEQATGEAGVAQQQQTAQTSAKSALQQARDLFRQTQQTNIAQLSGLGISSSSVAEALAERLGVETSRRIAGVTGSLNEVMQNASKELTRIQTYYKGKLSDLETQIGAAKANIQQQLLSGINQINQARNQAATDKANRRQELITNARAAAEKLALNAQNFQQTLDLWREQKAAALTPIAQDPNYVQNILAQTQKLNEQFAPTGFAYTPEFNINAQGNYTGQIKSNKKPEIVNPFES